MSDILRFIILILGMGFIVYVLSLLVRKRLNEKNSLLWIGMALIVFILSIRPHTLDKVARLVGVDYPPTLLFLVTLLSVLMITLYQSIQISRLNEKLKELSQVIAIRDVYTTNTDNNVTPILQRPDDGQRVKSHGQA